MPWFFFWLSVFGGLCTWNVYHPIRRMGPLIAFSFLAGWLVGDLALFHVAIQIGVTLALVSAGALEAWPGWVGLGISVVSWLFLLQTLPIARRSGKVFAQALSNGIGDVADSSLTPDHAAGLARAPSPGNPLKPFGFRKPGVKVIRDLPYLDDGDKRHRLDIYLPEGDIARAPVLLQIHGGAWTIGHKGEQAMPLMYHLAARGWICVATNYRLSPQVAYPDHLVDVKHALAWIRENIADFGGDPDFVCATGGSAGGHLSSMLALTANDPELQPGFEQIDTSIRACVPVYGVYDWTNEQRLQASDMTGFIAKRVMKRDFNSDLDHFRRASPIHRIDPDAPPFFVVHGDKDSLASVEEARAFVAKLRRISKEPVAYAEVPGAQHAFEIFHTARTQRMAPAIERFLAWAHSRYLEVDDSKRAAETASDTSALGA